MGVCNFIKKIKKRNLRVKKASFGLRNLSIKKLFKN